MAAEGAIVLHRHIPGHEIALKGLVLAGHVLTAVVGILLVVFLADASALHQPAATLGAAARHFHHQRHSKGAVRIPRAGQEPAKPARLDHQVPPALGAQFIGHLVGHLDAGALQILFRLLEALVKVPVEVPENPLPGGVPLLHGVQLLLHMGGELQIRNIGEAILHQFRHHPAQVGDMEVFPLLHHIFPIQDGGHRGGVGRGAADALFFHGPDKAGVGVVGGGLGEVLVFGVAL